MNIPNTNYDCGLAQVKEPRQIFLFSGHMVDAPDRLHPRLPNTRRVLDEARHAIREKLLELRAGPEDIALTQGSCGGDLLFSQVCLEFNVNLHWYQPFQEPEFIQRSVIQIDEGWLQVYYDVRRHLAGPIHAAPNELVDPILKAKVSSPFERCNLWLLDTALAFGEEKLQFICLWDGTEGDGPGSTSHMYNKVQNRAGAVAWIDTRKILKLTSRDAD